MLGLLSNRPKMSGAYTFTIECDYSLKNPYPKLKYVGGLGRVSPTSDSSEVQVFTGSWTPGSNYTLFAFSWQTMECYDIIYLETMDEVNSILTWSNNWFGSFEGDMYGLKEFLVDEELNRSGNFYVVIDKTGKVTDIQSVKGAF